MSTAVIRGLPRPRLIGRASLLALGAFAVSVVTALGPAAENASATAPSATDVVFIFDTSGSMQSVLSETQEDIKTLVASLESKLPNIDFGVANVEDLPGYDNGVFTPVHTTEAEYEQDAEKPWKLWQPLTSNQAQVEEAITKLSKEAGEGGPAHAGGDLPEAYGRALWETATNPNVGWRSGARHEIVLIGDNVPHTPNVNEGIPASLQFTEPGNDGYETWPNTGEETGGRFGIPGTQWKEGESLEFHKTLARLKSEDKPLAMVDYFHTGESEKSNYIHYWEYWAAATGGQAIVAEEGTKSLDSKLAGIIKESAEGIPPCPPGFTRTETSPCRAIVPPVEKHTPSVSEKTREIIWEVEFPEEGEAEFEGEVVEGAELARVHAPSLLAFQGALASQGDPFNATLSKHRKHKKSKACKKGFVKKDGRCVSRAPVHFGKTKLSVTKPGVYRLTVKLGGKVLSALKKGKTLNVKLNLVFTPAHSVSHVTKSVTTRLHFKKTHKKKRHHKGRHKKG